MSDPIRVDSAQPTCVPDHFEIVRVRDVDWAFCPIRQKTVKLTGHPEEIVRQRLLFELHGVYKYPWEQIRVEVPVKVGSTEAKKKADIVIYSDTTARTPRVFVEVKKEHRLDGLEQLKVYMNATGCRLGLWFNGTSPRVNLLRIEPTGDVEEPSWRELRDIPAKDEQLADVDNPLTRADLAPVDDFLSTLRDCEDFIKAHEGTDPFNEIFKLIVAKLYDERRTLKNDSSKARFRIGVLEAASEARVRIVGLFDDATKLWQGVFTPDEAIMLGDDSLAYCVSALQRAYLVKSDADILGAAFELMINPTMKGDKGQYFTPRHVIQMCVEALDPRDSETVFDPACGSGGFLVGALEHVFAAIAEERDDENATLDNQKDYASANVFGIDYDPLVAKVAKAYMLIWGDGRANICVADSLNDAAWGDEARSRFLTTDRDGRTVPRQFDIIMTNPPFAGAISASETLNRYHLAYRPDKSGRATRMSKVNRDILFVERCLDFLKPGGRMAIVLPRGLFKNYGDEPVRRFVLMRAQVTAVVGLSGSMFKPFTNTKTCVLFLHKRLEPLDNIDEAKDDAPIVFAVTERSGKDRSGRLVRLDDGTIDSDIVSIGQMLRRHFEQESELTWR